MNLNSLLSKNKNQQQRVVWMLIPSFYPLIGGAERQAQKISQVLISFEWAVHVLTRRHSISCLQRLPAWDIVEDIPVTRLYSRGSNKISSLFYLSNGLWYLVRYGRRGIYHAHDVGAPAWLAVIARYLLKGHSIVKLRTGRNAYEKHFSSRFARWQFFALVRLVDRIVVVNKEMERWLSELGIPETRVVCIPNGVDTTHFCPVPAGGKILLRKKLGFPPEKTVVLYVGRLEIKKGVDVLLRAWARIPKRIRAEALLVFVGNGTECEKLIDMMTFLDLRDSTLMVGAHQVVRNYYWAANIFVLPSRTEGLSNALIEAMACGLPVIASNVGGNPDVIRHGESGVLCESENCDQLAQEMVALITAPDRWADMGAQARRTVRAYANIELTVSDMHELYCQLV